MMVQASRKLQIIIVTEERLPVTHYTSRSVELQGISESAATLSLHLAHPAMDQVIKPCLCSISTLPICAYVICS